MRDLSNPALAAIYAQETSAVIVSLLTITHSALSSPIRLCTDAVDIVSRGDTYTAFPCQVKIAADQTGELPTVEIACDNVSRALVSSLRSITTPATIEIEAVLSDTPDVVEMGPLTCSCRTATWDRETVRLSLSFEPIASEPYPSGTYSPRYFAAMFKAVAVTAG